MKKYLCLFLAVLLLWGCAAPADTAPTNATIPTEEDNPMKNDLTTRFVSAAGETLPAEHTHSFKSDDIPELKTGDLVLLELEVKSDTGTKKLALTLYQGGSQVEETYFVPTQWSRIVLCTDPEASLAGLKLAAEEGISLRRLAVENKKNATPEAVSHLLGQFVVDDYESVELPEAGVGAGRTTDLVKSGNYIYSIGGGSFTVTDVSDPDTPKVMGRIGNLGNTRQIALCESGTDVMVTARGFGTYIIDASDPTAPRIRCTYDSLEMATGICISGQYAYISNRQYGVEVVDLSNLDDPRYVRTILSGEVQSAQVFDGRLYCGLYGEHRVDIYDLTAQEPVKIGEVPLNGRGDGMCLARDGDRILLYAATGHHSVKKLASNEPLTNASYGQGNGLDIVDVTDPQNVRWLSTVRADGRFYHTMYDYWEASVSELDGHRYAQVVSTYNGLYIYNVDDPTAPVRVAHVTVPIPQSSQNYTFYKSDTRTLVFPFNRSTGIQSPTGAVVCDDGVLYMSGTLTDLHILRRDQLGDGLAPENKALTISDVSVDYTGRRFDPKGQLHTVITGPGGLIAACGTDGIAMLDKELNLQQLYATQGTCYDVQLLDGVLYAAEGRAGLAAYDVATMTQLWRWQEEGRNIKQVRLSPKGRFAVLHAGDTMGLVLRLEDLTVVFSKQTHSQMYHHNVSATLVGGQYLCYWGQGTNEVWLDFGPEDDRAQPSVLRELTSRTSMAGGVVGLGDRALATTSKGYILYDPALVTDLKSLEVIPTGGVTGKPTIHGDLLIVTDRVTGKLSYTNISDPENPREISTQQLPGNPDIALVAYGSIYIPAGNAGLLKLPMP